MRKYITTSIVLAILVALAVIVVFSTDRADAAECNNKSCAPRLAYLTTISNCNGVFVKSNRGLDFIENKNPHGRKHVIRAHSRDGFVFSNGKRWYRDVVWEKTC